jgi:hypothetical protein
MKVISTQPLMMITSAAQITDMFKGARGKDGTFLQKMLFLYINIICNRILAANTCVKYKQFGELHMKGPMIC